LNHQFDDLRQPDDGEAVVTYTRISGGRKPTRPVRPRPERAPDPVLDAAEIYPAEPDEAVELHAGSHPIGAADIEDFVADPRRPRRRSFGPLVAALAVIAGVGILATSLGLATILPGGEKRDTASSERVPVVDSEVASTATVREIPMPGGPPEAAWRVESKPPIPRPRPDDAVASAEPGTDATVAPAPSAPPVGTAELQSNVPDVAAVPVLAPPASAPANSGSDGLITSIEETLARIDATPAPAAGGEPPQSLLPPQVAPPLAPAASPPPVVMTQPVYPPPANVVTPPVGQGSDILPPATIGGYDGYGTAAGPVPPEPVPEAYPQALPVYPDDQVYPQNPGSYPYVVQPETAEGTEASRRGFLGRTLAKATNAVGRVFARN